MTTMTSTMIGDPTVSSTTPPVYNPPPVTHAPQGHPVTPAPHQGQQMTPHQGQQTTPTGQAAASSSGGGDLLSHVSVTSDQVAINGDKCMFTLSPGRFAAVSNQKTDPKVQQDFKGQGHYDKVKGQIKVRP